MPDLKLVNKISVKHDGPLAIATAPSRDSVKWVNGKTKWSSFLNQIATTVRTKETLAAYRKMSKAEQGSIKDVGGFVGGTLDGNRRKTDSVNERYLVTLDADFAYPGLWDNIEMLFDNAVAMYSTHSHTPDKPRVRLVFPLTRAVSRDEYPAVARKLAEQFTLDIFDDTTYQAHRLMYWPSTAKDGEFLFDYIDAPFVDPDEVLASYVNWQDPLEWPTSSREREARKSLADKQGDPLSKPGLVGLFNRSYTVPEAIEAFLSDRYTPHSEDRYTFVDGSTAGGLVLYQDGLFAYSHHGTDPTSGQLVNAYDLVRTHLYGAQDSDVKDGTPINRLPSARAMKDLVKEDSRVKEVKYSERVADSVSDFDDVLDEATEPTRKVKDGDNAWINRLKMGDDDKFEASRTNLIEILSNDPQLAGKLALNEFSQRAVVLGDLPWRKLQPGKETWSDFDEAGLRNYLERIYEISHLQKTSDALAEVFHLNAFHPVRDYLEGLTWDNTPRLDTVVIDCLGAEDTRLNRAISRKTMVAAVARIFTPGCKWDYTLTLAGAQGLGKSSLFGRLGGEFYSDSLTTVTGKEAYEQLQGSWIIELAELSASRKADIESTKHFLTKRIDRFRVAYGRHVADFPRQCVFIGTTNDQEFLRDATGNRRFWVLPVGKMPIKKQWSALTDYEVDQMWAEAVQYFKDGEQLFLPADLEQEMKEVQAGHSEQSHLEGMILEHLERKVPQNFHTFGVKERLDFLVGDSDFDDVAGEIDTPLETRYRISAIEIWVEVLHGSPQNFPVAQRREINSILKNLQGWGQYEGNRQGRLRFGNELGQQKAYIREGFEVNR